ncbi:MAG: sugar phosphate nucleotidyltransferase [Bacteroidales bacterium]|jgi:glucose-1-phosphate cytidylyltransferase
MSDSNKNIPVVILAGGNGTNVGSNEIIPKPMVDINGEPLLKFIIEYFLKYDFKKFIITTGFKGDIIKKYIEKNKNLCKEINIEVVDTGENVNTGSRILNIKKHVENYDTFMVTYGDVYSDVDINELMDFHKSHKKTATVTAVHYPTRFRILGLYGSSEEVKGFTDKPVFQKDYINGGFYLLNKNIFNLDSFKSINNCSFELDVLEELVKTKELWAYKYNGFWQSLDTERDRKIITEYLIKKQ